MTAAARGGARRAYGRSFFEARAEDTRRSAEVVLPLVLELLHPRSIVDVGCGVGSWLAVARAHGVADILGVDGAYVPPNSLEIPPDNFRAIDLRRPPALGRPFDLVLCLEVGEHLPPESADPLVEMLVAAGPAILFSAAPPFQGGTGHLNEQWPGYWIRRFEARGFVYVDYLRPRIWSNPEVQYWYRQNSMLFVKPRLLRDHPDLQVAARDTNRRMVAVLHPAMIIDRLSGSGASGSPVLFLHTLASWSRTLLRRSTWAVPAIGLGPPDTPAWEEAAPSGRPESP